MSSSNDEMIAHKILLLFLYCKNSKIIVKSGKARTRVLTKACLSVTKAF